MGGITLESRKEPEPVYDTRRDNQTTPWSKSSLDIKEEENGWESRAKSEVVKGDV